MNERSSNIYNVIEIHAIKRRKDRVKLIFYSLLSLLEIIFLA